MLKMMSRSHLLSLLLLIPLLGFGLISLYYITGFHVWPLSRDQWHMYAPYFEQGFWQTMLSPMSSHRHIFPFFFFHLDMTYFNGRNHFLVACGAIFDGLIIYLLLRNLLKETCLSQTEKIVLAVFIITELVWLLNIAQLGWGFMSTQYYLAILTFLLAIYSAYQFQIGHYQNYQWALLSIACGVISTFSFGMGILVWPSLLYFAWVWRTPRQLMLFITVAWFVCLLLFFLLPGGESVEQALLLIPQETLRFTFQLASGPIYYLLKSWRCMESDTAKEFATVVGISASIAGLTILVMTALRRPLLSPFKWLCYSLMLLGLGTASLISLTRNANFLDVWVDRYQIWGTLFWTGFLPLVYLYLKDRWLYLSRMLLTLLASLPLLALPSQLDMGSRLYEYKTRVQEALLFYQVGIAEKSAAQDALHWNWEHKLPFFFYVLNELEIKEKNIYYQSPAVYIGKPMELLSKKQILKPLTVTAKHFQKIEQRDMLNIIEYPALENFRAFTPTISTDVVGYKMTAYFPGKIEWEYAVHVDENNIINGLGIHIDHSLLPRPTKDFIKRGYNFFAVVRGDGITEKNWYSVTPQANSK